MANKTVKNETVNNAIEEKEEKNMADQTKEKAPVKKEEKPEEPGTAVSTNVEKPDEEKESLGKRIWKKAKKPVIIAGSIAAGIGALFAAKKIGEARGFDKACDAFAAAGGDPYDPESGIPEDDIPEVDMSEIPETEVTDF